VRSRARRVRSQAKWLSAVTVAADACTRFAARASPSQRLSDTKV
jgi:hypothetical protein